MFQNEQSFTFPSLNDFDIQSEIWTLLIDRVRSVDHSVSHAQSLKVLKILRYITYLIIFSCGNYKLKNNVCFSRDKQYLDSIINPHIVEVLVTSSDVNPDSDVNLRLQYEG